MATQDVRDIEALLQKCTDEERRDILLVLSRKHHLHQYELDVGAPAELILESIHRANELTRRMLRGVIAECTYARFVIPMLAPRWQNVHFTENLPYDFKLNDGVGDVTIQVKLQRSARSAASQRGGLRYGFTSAKVYECETQKTRGGTDDKEEKTRPYRYGEFDILAVSMQPSTKRWDKYLYTVGNWLVEGKSPNEIAVMQPVESALPNDFWTDNFDLAVDWLRTLKNERRMAIQPSKSSPKKNKEK